jgi:hypothetical protein
MTVKELIEHLQTLDQNRLVVVPGYEGGVRDVGEGEEIDIRLNVNEEWYYGSHEQIHEGEEVSPGLRVKAVRL